MRGLKTFDHDKPISTSTTLIIGVDLHVLSLKATWLVSGWRALDLDKLTETIKVAMI